MRKTAQTFITLAPQTRARVRREASAGGRTLSEHVESILQERWHQGITAEDLLQRSEGLANRSSESFTELDRLAVHLRELVERLEQLCGFLSERQRVRKKGCG